MYIVFLLALFPHEETESWHLFQDRSPGSFIAWTVTPPPPASTAQLRVVNPRKKQLCSLILGYKLWEWVPAQLQQGHIRPGGLQEQL